MERAILGSEADLSAVNRLAVDFGISEEASEGEPRSMMETKCEYSKLIVPNDRAYAAIAANYAGEVARKVGMEQEDVQAVVQAVEQAIANVMEYSFKPGERADLEVSFERVLEGLKTAIRDKGTPFYAGSYASVSGEETLAEEKGLAAAIFRLQEFVDEVAIENLGPRGKQTILIKKLRNKDLRNYYLTCEAPPYLEQSEPEAPSEPIKVTARAMKPSEAGEVVKCIYEAYGFSYVNEHLYYPERIVELNENGRIHSAVAVTEDNQIAGHTALTFPGENRRIAELGQAVVRPQFRSHGVLAELSRYLIDKARSLGLMGVYARSVTVHTYSQKVVSQLGLRPCAIILAFFPRTEQFKGIAEKLERRVAAEVRFMYFNRPERPMIFPPTHHREMILRLYGKLGMTPEVKIPSEEDAAACVPDSIVRTTLMGSMGYARIDVPRCGKNVIQEVKSRLKDLRVKGFDVINLHLNLCDPTPYIVTEEVERLGFFFAGILPGGFSEGDALILQYLNNVPIDYGEIKLESGAAQEILSYVKEHDPN